MGISTASSHGFLSHMGFNYFLLNNRSHARVGSRLLHFKNADFIKVLLNFAAWCLGSSLTGQNWCLWSVVWFRFCAPYPGTKWTQRCLAQRLTWVSTLGLSVLLYGLLVSAGKIFPGSEEDIFSLLASAGYDHYPHPGSYDQSRRIRTMCL